MGDSERFSVLVNDLWTVNNLVHVPPSTSIEYDTLTDRFSVHIAATESRLSSTRYLEPVQYYQTVIHPA